MLVLHLLLLESLTLNLFAFSWMLACLANVAVAGVCGQLFPRIRSYFGGLLVVVVYVPKKILLRAIVVEFGDRIFPGAMNIVFVEALITGFMLNT